MAIANYATTSDLIVYLPQVTESEEDSIWNVMLGIASRAIDRYTDRYFYSAGPSTKDFDGDGTRKLYVPGHDFYSLTSLSVSLAEGNDPTISGQYQAFDGDGITVPSNFYCEPANQPFIGTGGLALLRPFYKLELPVTPKSGNFLSTFTLGKRTVRIAATWGWPAVPEEIKDLTIKIVVRMWQARQAGHTGQIGAPELGGLISADRYLDINDLATLNDYRRRVAGA